MRILLDENMPVGLRRLLPEHDVSHAARLGWQGVKNGGQEQPQPAEYDEA